jgi:hypothetical protein
MREDYGKLLMPDITLQRRYFNEMVMLLGVNVQYQSPIENKQYTLQGELETSYTNPVKVGCIFEEHISQSTAKKMGWTAELQENASVIHVPYDLEGLQAGALFEVPSGIDIAKPRLFRVISMQNIMVYPASIACEIAPEYRDTDEKTTIEDFTKTNFNLLVDNEEDD